MKGNFLEKLYRKNCKEKMKGRANEILTVTMLDHCLSAMLYYVMLKDGICKNMSHKVDCATSIMIIILSLTQ